MSYLTPYHVRCKFWKIMLNWHFLPIALLEHQYKITLLVFAQEIVNSLPSFSKGEPTWEEARTFGVGWVVTNINVLRRTVEKIAKASFQKTKDPMDSAIFYLAMKKKMILWGLYRYAFNAL